MKPHTTKQGLQVVILCGRDGVQRSRKVHLLVLAAFVGKVPAGQETRWANGNRADCRRVNLSYQKRSRPQLRKPKAPPEAWRSLADNLLAPNYGSSVEAV